MSGLFNNKYRIESTRLKHWDYSSCGYYFITICTKDREHFFGEIKNGICELSLIGKIVQKYWFEIPQHYENIDLDSFTIMPNHLHGIVVINIGNCIRRDVACNVSTSHITSCTMSQISPKPGSLSTVIRSFKSSVSNWCHKNKFHDFNWQPRFYEHIIRNEHALNRIREYILNNPINWKFDRNNNPNLPQKHYLKPHLNQNY